MIKEIKDFVFNSTNIIYIGFLGSIIMLFSTILQSYILAENILITIIINLFSAGFFFTIYFGGIILRKKNKNVNINLLQKILTAYSIIMTTCIFNFIYGFTFDTVITSIFWIVFSLYLINIFLRKGINVNNNIFIGIAIIYILSLAKTNVFSSIGLLLVVLYFYNYYNLLKGLKNNE